MLSVKEEKKMQFKNTGDLTQSNVCMLIYGRGGSGKTRWLASTNNPVILNSEDGLLSVRSKNIPYLDVKSYDEFITACKLLSQRVASKPDKPITVCVDSLTHLTDLMMLDISKRMPNPMDAYPELYKQTLHCLDLLWSLGCDVVVVAKHADTKIGKGKHSVEFVYPRFEGKRLRSEIMHRFGEVLYMADDVAYAKHSSNIEAKDRSGNLPERIDTEKTRLVDVFKVIKGVE